MFNLVIKSSHGPGNKLIMRRKISCGLYLVHRPLCFNHLIIYTYGFKFRPFYCMCQLKNKRNDHTCNYSHSQISDQPCKRTYTKNRYQYIKHQIQRFTKPKCKVFLNTHMLKWRIMDLPGE